MGTARESAPGPRSAQTMPKITPKVSAQGVIARKIGISKLIN